MRHQGLQVEAMTHALLSQFQTTSRLPTCLKRSSSRVMASHVESEDFPNVVWWSTERGAPAERHTVQNSSAEDRPATSLPPVVQRQFNKALSSLTVASQFSAVASEGLRCSGRATLAIESSLGHLQATTASKWTVPFAVSSRWGGAPRWFT